MAENKVISIPGFAGEIILSAKTFKTGSVGYFGFGKIQDAVDPTLRYQVSMNVVLIGSKPKADTEKTDTPAVKKAK